MTRSLKKPLNLVLPIAFFAISLWPLLSNAAIPQPSNICRRVLAQVQDWQRIWQEPNDVPYIKAIHQTDLEALSTSLQKARRPPPDPFQSREELMEWAKSQFRLDLDNLIQLESIAFQEEFLFSEYGSNVVGQIISSTKSDLRQYFKQNLPLHLQEVTTQTFDQLTNPINIIAWIKDVRHRVLLRMWNDGLRDKKGFLNTSLHAHYLDLELAARASRHGFVISDEKPWPMYTTSSRAFHRALKEKRLFNDWTGIVLEGGSRAAQREESFARHGVRGHALQMAYLSDHVPGFSDLISYIGSSRDKYSLWNFLFDNSLNPATPLWTGFWIGSFRDYLHINY